MRNLDLHTASTTDRPIFGGLASESETPSLPFRDQTNLLLLNTSCNITGLPKSTSLPAFRGSLFHKTVSALQQDPTVRYTPEQVGEEYRGWQMPSRDTILYLQAPCQESPSTPYTIKFYRR